jgi:hypothetical protein
MKSIKRRTFLARSAAVAAGLGLNSFTYGQATDEHLVQHKSLIVQIPLRYQLILSGVSKTA